MAQFDSPPDDEITQIAQSAFDAGYAQGCEDTRRRFRESLDLIINASSDSAPVLHHNQAVLDEDWDHVLDLSERPRNVLRRHQIVTVGDLLRMHPSAVLRLSMFGQRSLDELVTKLATLDIKLPPAWQHVYDELGDS